MRISNWVGEFSLENSNRVGEWQVAILLVEFFLDVGKKRLK
jgi:hypothetical protein